MASTTLWHDTSSQQHITVFRQRQDGIYDRPLKWCRIPDEIWTQQDRSGGHTINLDTEKPHGSCCTFQQNDFCACSGLWPTPSSEVELQRIWRTTNNVEWLWMVLRPGECPLVWIWIVLHSSASVPPYGDAGCPMQVEWAAPQGPAPRCTVAGEAPHEAVLGVDEGLLRAEARQGRQNAEQVRLLLNPQSGRIFCRWLRNAQQVGILT